MVLPLVIAGIGLFSGAASVLQATKEQQLKEELAKQNQLIEAAKLEQQKIEAQGFMGLFNQTFFGIKLWHIIVGGMIGIGALAYMVRR